jgi:hypothetical protein
VAYFETPGSALQVEVVNDFLYVADGIRGLRIADISNPLVPIEVGSVELAGSFSFAVCADGDFVYVANGDKGLWAIDVSDPANPVEVGFFDSPGNAWRVFGKDRKIYLADEGGGFFILELGILPRVGGENIKIQLNNGIPKLDWTGGDAQEGYLLFRYDVSGPSLVPVSEDPLTSDVTSYIDNAVFSGELYFYWLLAFDSQNSASNSSDLIGFIPNSSLGTLIPDDFSLQSNRLGVSTLEWNSVPGDPAQAILVTVPLNGESSKLNLIESGTTIAYDVTGGIPTCYSIITSRDFEIGMTNFLCVIPQ